MMPLLALLLVFDLEGLAALLWAFFTPSESSQVQLLWLSRERLVFVLFLLFILALLVVATLRFLHSRVRAEHWLVGLDGWLTSQPRLAPTLIGLSFLPVLISAGALAVLLTPLDYEAYHTWAPDTFPQLHSIVNALLPLLALVVVMCLQAAIFLGARYRRVLWSSGQWSWDRLAPWVLLLLSIAATGFHWLVLAFQLRFFVNIPAWYWIFNRVPFGAGDLWFILGALFFLALVYWLLIVKHQVAVGLVLVAALGWFLQIAVGLMGGGGIATLRERYFTTYHQVYLLGATGNDFTVLEGIRGYEQIYGSGAFTGTKPPGLMAFYVGLDHLVNGYPSAYDQAIRYERLANAVIWLFPVLAVSMVGLLYAFARRFLEDPSSLVQRTAPVLYVLAPSLALFTFFADQAVYPGAFLLGAWLTVLAIRRGSLMGAFLLGVILYIAVFFAFTMLPLLPFAGLYLLLHTWQVRPSRPVRRMLGTALAIAAGTLLMHVLSLALLNYNFLPRFQHAMAVNHNFDFYLRVGQHPPAGPESLTIRLGQIFGAAWVNNLDFAAAVGFPIYILFIAQAVRRAGRLIKDGAASGDIVLPSLLLGFLVLVLAGTAQGETPRLWLFWLPMVALLAACELEPHLRKRPQLLLALGVAQLVTLVLTFHFQDLRM